MLSLASARCFGAETARSAADRLEGSVILRTGSAKAFVNRVQTQIDPENPAIVPMETQDRTFVPLRFAAEALEAAAAWDEGHETAVVTFGGTSIRVKAGEMSYTVNGQPRPLDVPGFIQDGRMFLPLRAVAEALGKEVFWDESGLIILSDQPEIFDPVREKALIQMLNAIF